MEITITGRHTTVPPRFQRHIEDKLDKVSQLDPRVTRIEVVVSHENNPRMAKEAERVEITCFGKRAVIRAEASAGDEYGALDLASTKLNERLRRAQDKRRVTRGRKRPVSVQEATADLAVDIDEPKAQEPEKSAVPEEIAKIGGDEFSPVELREKVHTSQPMTISEALGHMEAVGHDFFLYQDSDTGQPSVLYRRHGWSYGVIHLDVKESVDVAAEREQTA